MDTNQQSASDPTIITPHQGQPAVARPLDRWLCGIAGLVQLIAGLLVASLVLFTAVPFVFMIGLLASAGVDSLLNWGMLMMAVAILGGISLLLLLYHSVVMIWRAMTKPRPRPIQLVEGINMDAYAPPVYVLVVSVAYLYIRFASSTLDAVSIIIAVAVFVLSIVGAMAHDRICRASSYLV